MKVGFVGIGTMGRGMALNCAKKYDVLVWNRTKEKSLEIASEKITVVDKLHDIAAADVVFTCVTDDVALEELLSQGLLETLEGKMLIDSSTVSVALIERIHAEAIQHNLKFLDAPITGSKLAAEGGTMLFMVGGSKEVFQQCLPIFETMGKKTIHCGPSTHGARAKISLNLAQALILESYLEALVLGVKNGVSLAVLEEVLENSGAKCGVGSFKMKYIKGRDFEQHFKLGLMHKDLVLAEKEVEKLGIALPLTEKITEVFATALARKDEDMCTIVKTLEENAGIELK